MGSFLPRTCLLKSAGFPLASQVVIGQPSSVCGSCLKSLESGVSLVAVHNKDLISDRASGSTVSHNWGFSWGLCRMYLRVLDILPLNRSHCPLHRGLYGVVREYAILLFVKKLSNFTDKSDFQGRYEKLMVFRIQEIGSQDRIWFRLKRSPRYQTRKKNDCACRILSMQIYFQSDTQTFWGPMESINNRSNGTVTRTTAEGNFCLKKFSLFSLHVRHWEITDLNSSEGNA